MQIKNYQTNLVCFPNQGDSINVDFDQEQGLYTRTEWDEYLTNKYDELDADEIDEILNVLDLCYTNDKDFYKKEIVVSAKEASTITTSESNAFIANEINTFISEGNHKEIDTIDDLIDAINSDVDLINSIGSEYINYIDITEEG